MKATVFTPLLAAALLAGSAHAFELTSQDLRPGQPMGKAQEYQGFGCQGGNRSPQLSWRDVPAGTRSFALSAYDPDAPTGSGWWHWVVFNLPASTRELPAGAGSPDGQALPAGAVQSRTDYGSPGYGGACPPAGDKPHRYRFRLVALDVERLDLPPDSSAALVGFMVNSHKLGEAVLEATYQR